MRRVEREKVWIKKNLRSTSKLQLRHHWHHQTNLDKKNSTISIKVFNGAQSVLHSSSKDKWELQLWEKRREKKERKKKTSKTQQNSNNDTIDTIGKISMKQIQRQQGRSRTVTELGHTSCPNILGFICLQTTHVAHSGQHLWPFLVSLDLSRWYFLNNTSDIITRASLCLQELFTFF